MKMTVSIVAALTMGSLLFPNSASAADCSITGPTGPGSNNQCTVNDQCNITVGNNTEIDLSNNNGQTAGSGNGSTSGNTNGGGASSGSAGNNSSTDVTVDITNGTVPTCAATPGTTPQTPTTSNPGGGVAGTMTAVTSESQSQVDAPDGGVAAGAGGIAAPLLVASIVAAATGAGRLRQLTHAR